MILNGHYALGFKIHASFEGKIPIIPYYHSISGEDFDWLTAFAVSDRTGSSDFDETC